MPGWILTVYYISEWIIRIGMTPVVVRRRRPEIALAWLACIYFLPWLGLFLYLLLGQRYLGERRYRHHLRRRHAVTAPELMFEDEPEDMRPYVAPEQDDLVRLCRKLTNLPIIGGNHVDFITDSCDIVQRIVDDVDQATKHVHVFFYIFRADETGGKIIEAMARAAQRGVVTRLLIDSVGSKEFLKADAARARAMGIDVREALPAGILRRKFRRLDLRNHRKLVVIDGRISYTGSWNAINPDYGRNRKCEWQDIFLRIAGPATSGLQVVFLEDWAAEAGPVPDAPDLFPPHRRHGRTPIQIVPSGPNDHTNVFGSVTVAAIHEAQSRVILTTPYFVPDETVLSAMRLAVLRGVQVDLVVPKKCDHLLCGAAAESYYTDLLESGIILHRHRTGLLHSKTLSIDTAFSLVGSGNIDSRSFHLNFELSLLLYGDETTQRLREVQEQYIAESDRLTLEEWRAQPTLQFLVRDMAALCGPVL